MTWMRVFLLNLVIFLSVSNIFALDIQSEAARNQAMERQMDELSSAQEQRFQAMELQISRLASMRERLMDEAVYKVAQKGKERFFFMIGRAEALVRPEKRLLLPV